MTKFRYTAIAALILLSVTAYGCGEKENQPPVPAPIVEGPSADDAFMVPANESIPGDSLRYTRAFLLAEHPVKKVSVSTTQNGHISLLGGYKDQAAVHVFAKGDGDADLGDEQIRSILEKYFDVTYDLTGSEIIIDIKRKTGAVVGPDFRDLSISVKVYAPQNISTDLKINRGSIIASNVKGNSHVASSVSGAIKYIGSYGNNITVRSETGYIGMINTLAAGSVTASVSKGNILFALPKDTSSNLRLESLTRVNAYILGDSNFSGVNTRTLVNGKLNGGGFSLVANSGIGVINLGWFDGIEGDY